MRVLFVSHHGALGGAERSLLELLAGLRDREVQLMLACPAPGALADAASELGARVFPLKLCPLHRHLKWTALLGFSSRWVRVTFALARIIVGERVDLVHTNNSLAQLWSWPAIWLTRRPFVWHWRDFYDFPNLNRVLTRGRGICVAVSRSVLDFAKGQVGNHASVVLVPNGAVPPKAPPTPESVMRWRSERGIEPSAFLAVAMGQAIPRKGFSVLIRALALARTACANLRVFLACPVQDDESRLHLQGLRNLAVGLGCEERLILAHGVDQPGVALCAADVVVVPSLREPFGRVPLEAMLVGKPTICSDVDGLAEVVEAGSTGILVPPGDPYRLCDALVAVASNREWSESLGARGRQRALERFAMHRSVDAVRSVYEQLCYAAAATPWGRQVRR